MKNKQIEEIINLRNKEMNLFVEKARNGCSCHGVGMML